VGYRKGTLEKLVSTVLSPFEHSYWYGRRVLVTGHTGFKGGWLTIWLAQLGCKVTGLSLKPQTIPALFQIGDISTLCESHFVDIRDVKKVIAVVEKVQPEVVFHLAAQALVSQGYRDPINTFLTNTMGTANILEAARSTSSVKAMVMVTTDKVYRNNADPKPYKEGDTLGGHDPYGASKAASELIIDSYSNAFLRAQGVAVASARAGNVIGGGDWAAERLIPDAIRAWSDSQSLQVRHPDSIRPWQHVLEPLHGYIVLAQQLATKTELAGTFNFGPAFDEVASVRRVIELAQNSWEDAQVTWDDSMSQLKEAGWLRLDSRKSCDELGVQPIWDVEEAVKRTMAWYRNQVQGVSPLALCKIDIKDYEVGMGKKYALKINEN
jgi:CDP-glucose 4,6-dehydratase